MRKTAADPLHHRFTRTLTSAGPSRQTVAVYARLIEWPARHANRQRLSHTQNETPRSAQAWRGRGWSPGTGSAVSPRVRSSLPALAANQRHRRARGHPMSTIGA